MNFTLPNTINNKGFTLIELLVSVLILSFILAIATFSLEFFTSQLPRIINIYPDKVLAFYRMETAINSAFYYVKEDRDNLSGNLIFSYYFDGENHEIRFITSSSAIYSGTISVVEIKIDGGKLVMKESPVYSKDINYKDPQPKQFKTIILSKNVKNISLKYYLDGKEFDTLKDKMPELIKMILTFRDNKIYDYSFKIKSNFWSKNVFTKYLYNSM